MKFFLDNMISPKFARALREVGKDVIALRERFPEDASDEEWLTEISQESPVVITLDQHIRTRPLERRALSQGKIITFFLGPFFAKNRLWDQFVWLVRHWGRIEEMASGLARGTCMLVRQNGKMNTLPRV